MSSASPATVEAPSTIYHLAQKQDWEKAVAEKRDYFTDSLEKEGFTHATAETKLILTIANAFYQSAPGDFVLLVIDTPKLSSKVVMEKGDAPLPGSDDPEPPTCPHILGKIEQKAVRAVRQVTREEGTGKFLSIEME